MKIQLGYIFDKRFRFSCQKDIFLNVKLSLDAQIYFFKTAKCTNKIKLAILQNFCPTDIKQGERG